MKHSDLTTVKFPLSRIATFDIGALGKSKHYVTALLEFDVTDARKKIKASNERGGARISFTGWLLKVIGETVFQHKSVAAYRRGRRSIVIFEDIDISTIVEREKDGQKVPLPLVIRKANEKSAAQITGEIEKAKTGVLAVDEVVLGRGKSLPEKLYYHLPAALRRAAWRFMLGRPRFIFRKMGNVVVTSVGMFGRINGWFIQTAIHPLAFGIGSIVRKPVAAGEDIRIGEILYVTILMDHNVIDGAPMARFVKSLAENIENGIGLD